MPGRKPAHLESGSRAEDLACEYLAKQGLDVADRNVRTPYGEIDIVCRHDESLVFVEVRYRRQTEFGTPAETVDARKQHRLRASAEHYLQHHRDASKKSARFDIVAIHGPLSETHIEWLVNAF